MKRRIVTQQRVIVLLVVMLIAQWLVIMDLVGVVP